MIGLCDLDIGYESDLLGRSSRKHSRSIFIDMRSCNNKGFIEAQHSNETMVEQAADL